MQRMSVDQLHVFLKIAETGSLSAAAETLFRSQSTISEQLRKLEQTCGSALFVRNKSGAMITPIGERLLSHAQAILNLSDQALADVRGIDMSGDLNLAVTDYFLPRTIAPMLRRVGETYPDLRLNVAIESGRRLAQSQEAGQRYDIVLFLRLVGTDNYTTFLDQTRSIRRERLQWVANDEIKLTRSMTLPIITLPEGCRVQHHALAQLQKFDRLYATLHSASSVSGLQTALQAGLGIGCLNESSIPHGVSQTSLDLDLPDLHEVEFCISFKNNREDLANELHKVFYSEMRLGEISSSWPNYKDPRHG